MNDFVSAAKITASIFAILISIHSSSPRSSIAQFTTVINIPPSVADDRLEPPSDTQINLLDGGTLEGITVGDNDGSIRNVQFNLLGGSVKDVIAYAGGAANIVGGTVERRLEVLQAGDLSIQGGVVVGRILASRGRLELSGGIIAGELNTVHPESLRVIGSDFRLDDKLIDGLLSVGDSILIEAHYADTLSGVLLDGTPFVFSEEDHDNIKWVTLVRGDVAPPTPAVFDAAVDVLPTGVRAGQTLNVGNGATVGDNFSASFGSTVHVLPGGSIGEHLEAAGTTVSVEGGSIGARLQAFYGSDVHVSSGRIDRRFSAFDGSHITLSGGDIGTHFQAHRGSIVRIVSGTVGADFSLNGAHASIEGGRIGDRFQIRHGSNVVVSGGVFGREFNTNGDLTIRGTDFRVNGVLVNQADVEGDVIVTPQQSTSVTGILEDGTPFAFNRFDNDLPPGFSNETNDKFDAPIRLQFVPVDTPATTFIRAIEDPLPPGIREGQTLLVEEGSSIPSLFSAGHGSVVQIRGGQVGEDFEAIGAEVHVSGGRIAHGFDAFEGTTVNISGGTFEGILGVFRNSLMSHSGGTIENVSIHEGGQLIVEGSGSIGSVYMDSGKTTFLDEGSATEVYATGDSLSVMAGGNLDRALIGDDAELFLSGGHVDTQVVVDDQGRFVVTRGRVSGDVRLQRMSTADISGGMIEGGLRIEHDSDVRITGGTIGDGFNVRSISSPTLVGRDFRLDGTLIDQLQNVGDSITLRISESSALSGVLADGTPFYFSHEDGEDILTTSLSMEVAKANTSPGLITLSEHPQLLGAYQGQRLIVDNNAHAGNSFNAGRGSLVEIAAGGVVGNNFESYQAHIQLNGGAIGADADLFPGSQLIVTDGMVGDNLDVYAGSRISISGGTVGDFLRLRSGSRANISGGEFGKGYTIEAATDLDISGGVFPHRVSIGSDAVLNVSGGEFSDLVTFGARSQVAITGGQFFDRIRGHQYTEMKVTNAHVQGIDLGFASELSIHGDSVVGPITAGSRSTITINNGVIGSVIAPDALLDIADGTFLDGASLSAGGVIRSGQFGDEVSIDNLSIRGGTFGDRFQYSRRSQVPIATLEGSDFRINGEAVANLDSVGDAVELVVPLRGSVLSGIFADGTPFVFAKEDRSDWSSRVFRLRRASVPAATPLTLIASQDALPLGIREDQELIVDAGAVLQGDFNAGKGSRVIVNPGGEVLANLETQGELLVRGGMIGDRLDAFGASTVTIESGRVGDDFQIYAHADVKFVDGQIGEHLEVLQGGQLNIQGGIIGSHALLNGHVSISSGAIADHAIVFSGTVHLSGGSLGNDLVVGREGLLEVVGGTVGNGLVSDGGTILVATDGEVGQRFHALSQSKVTIGGGRIRNDFQFDRDSTVTIDGGILGDNGRLKGVAHVMFSGGTIGERLHALASSVVMSGGQVGDSLTLENAEFQLSGGVLGDFVRATAGSTIRISGGTIGDELQLRDRASVNLQAGNVGKNASLDAGSILEIHGGEVAEGLTVGDQGFLQMTGGSLDHRLAVLAGGEFAISARSFSLDGAPLLAAEAGVPFELEARDVLISGILVDLTPFQFHLSTNANQDQPFFSADSTITLTQLEPVKGDYNGDGEVSQADLDRVLLNWGRSGFDLPQEGLFDLAEGKVDQEELDRVLINWGLGAGAFANGRAVPEPASLCLLLSGLLGMLFATAAKSKTPSVQISTAQ